MNSHAILIFDPEEAVRDSLHLVFTEEGFQCFSTGNEVEALRVLLSEPISLLIIDSQVPGLQTMVQTIKRSYPSLNIILQSSYAEAEVTQQALTHGADDFILKPLDFDELIALVRNMISTPAK
jgi:DNA-binding NtrC family response regulator